MCLSPQTCIISLWWKHSKSCLLAFKKIYIGMEKVKKFTSKIIQYIIIIYSNPTELTMTLYPLTNLPPSILQFTSASGNHYSNLNFWKMISFKLYVWVCLAYFNIKTSSSIHVVTYDKISFFYGWILFHLCTYHIFFIYSSTGHSHRFHILALMSSAAINMEFNLLFSLSLNTYSVVELLDFYDSLSFKFLATSMMFSIIAALIFISTSIACGSPFPHLLTSTCKEAHPVTLP